MRASCSSAAARHGSLHGGMEVCHSCEGTRCDGALGDPGGQLVDTAQGGNEARPVGCVEVIEGGRHSSAIPGASMSIGCWA